MSWPFDGVGEEKTVTACHARMASASTSFLLFSIISYCFFVFFYF